MKSKWLLALLLFAILFAAVLLPAQEKPAQVPQTSSSLFAYDLNRELTLVGTVLSYSVASSAAPFGPRVSLQTPSGVIDIHLGDARLLAANHFTIQQGDTLRIVGENVAYSGGTQFVARIIQKGREALLLRNRRGLPIFLSAPRRNGNPAKQGSVL